MSKYCSIQNIMQRKCYSKFLEGATTEYVSHYICLHVFSLCSCVKVFSPFLLTQE